MYLCETTTIDEVEKRNGFKQTTIKQCANKLVKIWQVPVYHKTAPTIALSGLGRSLQATQLST